MTIVNYEIRRNVNHNALEQDVRDGIDQGWQPFGNLVVEKVSVNGQTSIIYMQVMVRYN
jgi:hypothetical protein